jgi:4-hydroxy-tetrahydrodipicolinate synthase
MDREQSFAGVMAPVLTPFGEDGAPDADRFVEHCEWLIGEGCTALAPFGTTSEGPSLGLDERMELLEDLADSVDPALLMPATGSPSLTDAIALTQHAVDIGCGGVLVLPPYYFKQPTDDGLFRFYSELIEEVADDRLRLYLYNFPRMTAVPLSMELIARLLTAYPDQIAGLKDSSGDIANTKAVIAAFPSLEVFSGSEALLAETLAAGGAGCISASANVAAGQIRQLYDDLQRGEAGESSARVAAIRGAIQRQPLIPFLKAIVAHYREDPQWRVVRPPLETMPEGVAAAAIRALADEHGLAPEFA